MKLIIDIDEEVYKTVLDKTYCGSLYWELQHGIPINTDGDLISREALKEEVKKYLEKRQDVIVWESDIYNIIDNAPTVEINTNEIEYKAYCKGLEDGKKIIRPQGEWIIVKDEKWGDNVKCPFCEKELAGTDLNFCCKCGAKLIGSEKMNGGAE